LSFDRIPNLSLNEIHFQSYNYFSVGLVCQQRFSFFVSANLGLENKQALWQVLDFALVGATCQCA